MRLDEAQQWLTSRAMMGQHAEGIGHSAYVDQYQTGDEATRARLVDAMTQLLVDGDDHDQLLATSFFGRVGAPPDALRDLASLYVARGFEGSHPLAKLLGLLTYHLPPDAAAILKAPFNADPLRHFGLAQAVLRHDRRGPTWDTFARVVPHIQDPEELARGFQAAFAAQRVPDYFAMLRRRPASLLRAVASRLDIKSGEDLLTATLSR